MIRMLQLSLIVAGLALLYADRTRDSAPTNSADEARVSQRYGCQNCPQNGGSYRQGSGRTTRGGVPGGRTYYNGRYYGNYNNRFYGPQYGYF
jgi:hypothetical protein